MSRNSKKTSLQEAEERVQKRKRIRREEEEEDLEISEYYHRLEYMYGNCPVCDQETWGLIEEQQGLLNLLSMKKRDFLEDVNLFL